MTATAIKIGETIKPVFGMAKCKRCKSVRRVEGTKRIWHGGLDRMGNELRSVRVWFPEIQCLEWLCVALHC